MEINTGLEKYVAGKSPDGPRMEKQFDNPETQQKYRELLDRKNQPMDVGLVREFLMGFKKEMGRK